MLGGPHDRAGSDLRLVDRWDGLRPPSHVRAAPIELRRVHRGEMDLGDPDAALVVEQLGSHRLREPVNGMLRPAVSGLERNAAVRECGSDLHDDAVISRSHAAERRHRPVHGAQVRHVSDAPELVRLHPQERREHGRHRVVDPDIDRAQPRLDFLRCRLDLIRRRHIGRDGQRNATILIDVLGRGLQAVGPPSKQRDAPTEFGELNRCGTPNSRRCAGDHDHLARLCSVGVHESM